MRKMKMKPLSYMLLGLLLALCFTVSVGAKEIEIDGVFNDWNRVEKTSISSQFYSSVAFVQDGTRSEEIASDRENYSRQIKALFDKYNISCFCISGDYYERFIQAKKLLERIGLTTVW